MSSSNTSNKSSNKTSKKREYPTDAFKVGQKVWYIDYPKGAIREGTLKVRGDGVNALYFTVVDSTTKQPVTRPWLYRDSALPAPFWALEDKPLAEIRLRLILQERLKRRREYISQLNMEIKEARLEVSDLQKQIRGLKGK